jgi:hypothetical protein
MRKTVKKRKGVIKQIKGKTNKRKNKKTVGGNLEQVTNYLNEIKTKTK